MRKTTPAGWTARLLAEAQPVGLSAQGPTEGRYDVLDADGRILRSDERPYVLLEWIKGYGYGFDCGFVMQAKLHGQPETAAQLAAEAADRIGA